ncbi:uncharacterized protein [Henckelia pumila]|uniref:uncharacterized protein n=1 Tax=Henckelia pumila TaxID=405737 RepID=UPI003C6E78E6
MKNFDLVVGMKFKNAHEFREVLRDYSVREGYELTLKKNESYRVTTVCKKGCDWRIHASSVMGGPTFQIKTIKGEHNCAKSNTNKFANYKYLGKRVEKIVRDNPDINIDQLKNTITRKCEVELRKYNPGSKFILRKKEDFETPTFEKLYFSLNAMKNAFLEGCRPIIGLDGCFLKTIHGGQMFVAIGRDGNENMVPIALAVVQMENRENWTWFLRELLEDIGGLGDGR